MKIRHTLPPPAKNKKIDYFAISIRYRSCFLDTLLLVRLENFNPLGSTSTAVLISFDSGTADVLNSLPENTDEHWAAIKFFFSHATQIVAQIPKLFLSNSGNVTNLE